MNEVELINLAPGWINLIKFVQKHPFVTFKDLKFAQGTPLLGEVELSVNIIETFKF